MPERTVGELLVQFRQRASLTQKDLAQKSQVSLRALQYWEKGQYSPRQAELEAVLTALQVTDAQRREAFARLTTPRGIQMARQALPDAHLRPQALEPLPAIGDLIRVLRLRQGLSQEQVAERLKVTRATIVRWEQSRSLPGAEALERLCQLLRAHPEERAALHRRRLEPPHWKNEIGWPDYLQHKAHLVDILWHSPLTELSILALKRQLRLLLPHTRDAWRELAWLELQYAGWLLQQERFPESRTVSFRSLQMLDGSLSEDPLHYGILNLVSSSINLNRPGLAGLPESFRFLSGWLPQLADHHRIIPLCDMALYAAVLGQTEESARLLNEAQRRLQFWSGTTPGHLAYFQRTGARTLKETGRAIESLEWLPPLGNEEQASLEDLLLWADHLLAADDRSTAARYLNQARYLLSTCPQPARQRRWEKLARSL